MKHLSFRRLTAALLAVCLLLALTACGKSDPDAAQPAGQVLKFAIGAEPDNLSPLLSSASDTGGMMMNVYEGLLTFDENGNFLPCLAESYEIEDGGLTYRFHLKPDILFHNGQPLTAEDVQYTYARLAGLDGEAPLSKTYAEVLGAVETPDPATVVFRLNHVDAGFLCRCIFSVMQKGYTEDSTHPIGTGPYKFKKYVPGQKLVLEKNPDYHTVESRIPEIEQVEFRIMTDPNAVLMALKSGGLDIADIDPTKVDVLGEDFYIVEGLWNTIQLMGLNNDVAPFDKLEVRQAINYAVDKDEIVQAVTQGHGQRLESFLSPRMDFYFNKELTGYPTDPAKAKELLVQAGYPDGFAMTLTVPNNYPYHVNAAQIIKNQLENAGLGITVDIELVEWGQWLDQVYKKGNYQATLVGHTGKLDPQDFMNRFSSTYARNYFHFADPAYDALIEAGASTTDPDERAAIYKECQAMLSQQAAAVFIQDPYRIFAVNKQYTNMRLYPEACYDIGSIRLAD